MKPFSFFIILLSIVLISSCETGKRLYRPGFYVHHPYHVYRPGISSGDPGLIKASASQPVIDPSSVVSVIAPDTFFISDTGALQQKVSEVSTRGNRPGSPLKKINVRQNTTHDSRKNAPDFGDDAMLLLIILIEIVGIALLAWAATLVFPNIPIWLAIIIGLLAFYLLLVILYLIFARHEV